MADRLVPLRRRTGRSVAAHRRTCRRVRRGIGSRCRPLGPLPGTARRVDQSGVADPRPADAVPLVQHAAHFSADLTDVHRVVDADGIRRFDRPGGAGAIRGRRAWITRRSAPCARLRRPGRDQRHADECVHGRLALSHQHAAVVGRVSASAGAVRTTATASATSALSLVLAILGARPSTQVSWTVWRWSPAAVSSP